MPAPATDVGFLGGDMEECYIQHCCLALWLPNDEMMNAIFFGYMPSEA